MGIEPEDDENSLEERLGAIKSVDSTEFEMDALNDAIRYIRATRFPREGYVLVPIEPTDEMVEYGLGATSSWLDIPGSRLTVNREKMRRRYRAMIKASRP